MNRFSLSLAVFMALASTALAGPAAMALGEGPVLVWGVSAVSELPEGDVNSVASWLPGAVSRSTGMDVIDDDSVDEGIDLAMDNGECAENNMACVVEVARALDAPEAVSGDLGMVNGVYILTLRRIDAASGNVIKQVTAQSGSGLDLLVQSMSDIVANLYDIPHGDLGTVRVKGSTASYDYVVITYGPWFTWIEPVTWIGYYPWWWAGPIHYYHHHHRWYGWHHRHPSGRPRYFGPRREYPHGRHHRPHGGDGRPDGDRYDGGRHDGHGGHGGGDGRHDSGRDDNNRPDGDRNDRQFDRDNRVRQTMPSDKAVPETQRRENTSPDVRGVERPSTQHRRPDVNRGHQTTPRPTVHENRHDVNPPAVRENSSGGGTQPAVRGNSRGNRRPADNRRPSTRGRTGRGRTGRGHAPAAAPGATPPTEPAGRDH